MTRTLSFQPFGHRHLDDALRLSREAGWPHRRDDWALVQSVSRGIAALQDGAVIATALATPYGPVAMANMIIVDPRMRGRGLGRDIMQRALALAQPRQWRLVATPAGLPLYENLGFATCGTVIQHQGAVADLAAPPDIRWATPDDRSEIAAMDRAATASDRSALLQALASHGRIAIAKDKGYAILRAFGRGEVAGPVVADNSDTAQKLLGFVFAGRAGGFMRVDATAESGLSPWLEWIGLAEADRGIAMQHGSLPAENQRFTRFALAAQALG